MSKFAFVSKALTAGLVLSAGFAMPAFAQLPVSPAVADVAEPGDTAWMLAAAAFALFAALPGLAMFFGGALRKPSVAGHMVQMGGIAALVSVLWVMVGYTLAFGIASNGIIGNGNAWMLIALGNVRVGTFVPESAFALFQMGFVLFAALLLTGGWAERAKLGWAMAFAGLWSLIVYAPIAHWLWGGGWLAGLGAVDFAGGLTVHLAAGMSALVAALMVGRREGWPQVAEASSPAMRLGGAALVWIGGLALVGGSAYAATDDASAAIVNAHLASCVGALAWMILDKVKTGKVGLNAVATGAVAGLAAIAAGAGYVSPGGAIVMAAAGALLAWFARGMVRHVIGIDDALDVFAVHGVAGISGALLTAIFIGFGLGGTGYAEGMGPFSQFMAQLVAIGVIAIWSIIGTMIIGFGAAMVLPMRDTAWTETPTEHPAGRTRQI